MNIRIIIFLSTLLLACASFAGTKSDNTNDYIFGKSITVSNSIIMPPRNTSPTIVEGGMYYNSIIKQYMMSTDGVSWVSFGSDNYAWTNMVNAMKNILTNVPVVFNTNNMAIAGCLDTNYTINIPTSWQPMDIENAVAKVPPIFGGSNVTLTLDWADGTHDYGTNSLIFEQIFKTLKIPGSRNDSAITTNNPIKLVGNPESPITCKIKVGAGSVNNQSMRFYAIPRISMNGFYIECTNASRGVAAITVGNGSRLEIFNTVVSNASSGFFSQWYSTVVTTNCTAINCGFGFRTFGGASLYINGPCYATNCSQGYSADGQSYLRTAASRADCCVVGLYAINKSFIDASSSIIQSNITGNYAINLSYIYASGQVDGGNNIYSSSPFYDTVRSDGSLIYGTGIASTRTLYISATDSMAAAQARIDTIGKNLGQCVVTIMLASNKYTMTGYGLSLQNFYNGTIFLSGTNYTAYVNATNQASILDGSTAGVAWDANIINNAALVQIYGIKFLVPNSFGSPCVYTANNAVQIYAGYNCYFGTNSNAACQQRGFTSGKSSSVFEDSSTAVNIWMGWDGSYGDIKLSDCKTSIATVPAYTAGAYLSDIRVGGTNYQGSTAVFASSYGGLVVTNTGKILP